MSNLVKIKDVSNQYDVTARTLRYYEDMGLLTSVRSTDYAYRMYDEGAIRRLEQILILRKLNISIKDIQRVFSASGSNVNRLLEISDRLDKKIPDIMVVRIPDFKAVTVGVQSWDDMFKYGGYMYQLWQKVHLYKPVIFDCFDFLLSVEDKAEWLCAVNEDVDDDAVAPFDLIDFKGGLYAMAVSIDEDNESLSKVEGKVRQWIENTNFSIDEDRNVMFNMPYLYEDGRDPAYREIELGLGYKQMQRYFPIKLKEEFNNK